MRILVVAAEFPPRIGGVGAYTHALALGLQQAGAAVRVVTTWGDPSGNAAPGLAVTRTPEVLNRRYLKTLPLLVASIFHWLRDRPDWVVLMKCTHEGLVGHVLHHVFGARCAVVAYGADVLEQRRNPICRAVFRFADQVLVDSVYTQGLVTELGIDRRRVHVFYPGFAPVPLLPDDQVRRTRAQYGVDGKPLLLTVARLVRNKGHDRMLETLPLLAQRHPDLVYLIVGGGEERARLERQIAALGLTSRARMLGQLPWDEVERLYQACDVFVMPSRQEATDVEGLGIAFFEAGLRGKPVVGGNSGGVPDAVRDGETGFLVDPSDPVDIARAVDLLLSDPALRRRMGETGRRRVLEEFSVARSADRLGELFGVASPEER